MDSPVVDEDVVHFEVGLLRGALCVKPHKGVAKALSGFPVLDDVAGSELAESGEDDLEVLLGGHGVELADEEHVLLGGSLGRRQVPNHLQHHRPAVGLGLSHGLLDLLRRPLVLLGHPRVLEAVVVPLPHQNGRGLRDVGVQARGILEGVVQNHGVPDPYVLPRPPPVVAEGLVYPLHRVDALGDLAEDGVLPVEAVQVVVRRDVELGGVQVLARVRHGDRPPLRVPSPEVEVLPPGDLVLEVPRLVAVEDAVDGAPAPPRPGGVPRLHDEVLLHVVKEAVVVVLDLAELEKVLAREGGVLGEEVDDDVPLGGLQEDRHG